MSLCETPIEMARWNVLLNESRSRSRTSRKLSPEKERAILNLLQRDVHPNTIVSNLKTSRQTIQKVETRAKQAGLL